jgi:hypothetical protein
MARTHHVGHKNPHIWHPQMDNDPGHVSLDPKFTSFVPPQKEILLTIHILSSLSFIDKRNLLERVTICDHYMLKQVMPIVTTNDYKRATILKELMLSLSFCSPQEKGMCILGCASHWGSRFIVHHLYNPIYKWDIPLIYIIHHLYNPYINHISSYITADIPLI